MRTDPIAAGSPAEPSAETIRADRTIATLFMSWRFSGLATGLAALVAGRKRYRSQPAAAAQMLGAASESVWLARRFAGHGYRFDRATRLVDPATAVATLLVGRANLDRADRLTWINWAPWSFAANAASGRAIDGYDIVADAIGAAAVIAAAAVAAADRWSDRLVNTAGMSACFAGGQIFARQIRNGAVRLEAARSSAIDEGRRLAIEQERSRQLRLLHDSALQTLEAVASGRYDELDAIRAMARDEHRRLELEIVGESTERATIHEAIKATVDEHRRRGLHVDLTLHAVGNPAPAVVLALRDACNESLTNVRKHAGTARAEVSVVTEAGVVRVTVGDDGTGFDPARGLGFGTTESILRRMAEAGGGAEIDSAPEQGTRVRLWGPDRMKPA